MVTAGGTGARIEGIHGHGELFTELPSRIVVATATHDLPALLARAADAGVPAAPIGMTGGDRLTVDGLVDLPVVDVSGAAAGALPAAFDEEV